MSESGKSVDQLRNERMDVLSKEIRSLREDLDQHISQSVENLRRLSDQVCDLNYKLNQRGNLAKECMRVVEDLQARMDAWSFSLGLVRREK
jgi:uncharacterized protein YigA (DUF484 family)